MIQELRREHDLALLLEIARLPRSTFYYHLKHSKVDKYAQIKEEITRIFHENKGRYGYTFVEDELVRMLKQLVARTGAKLVLSSTWRQGWIMREDPEEFPWVCQADIRLFEALVAKLQEYDLELIDYTPIFGTRGQEIDWWIRNKAPEPVESFVILDDMDERYFRPHSKRLVQTTMSRGLSQRHVEQAVTILKEGYDVEISDTD